MANKILTNDDILLSQGLVEFEDPIDGRKKQVTVDVAIRIAEGNTIMKKKLKSLGVELEPKK